MTYLYQRRAADAPRKTRTGIIPGHACPKCGAALLVIDKSQAHVTYGRNPQFIGCSAYPACNYRTTVTDNVREIMDQLQKEADLLPAEF